MKEQNPGTLLDSIQAEVSGEASPLLSFLMKHARLIFLVLFALIALVVAAGVWNYYSSSRLKDMREELGRIIIMPETGSKLAALEDFSAKADAKIMNAALLALMQSATAQGRQEKAAEAWRRLAAGDGAFAFVARLAEAEALSRLEDIPGGIARLEALLPEALPEEYAVINGFIADMAEKNGDWERAAAACAAVLERNAALADKNAWEQRLAYYRAKR
ncbi:MAG: hypothetical protein LBQ63_06160 [Deltaproteobacteria bacterium]|jgi:hypothetical protein|nr:hypothetical protein [Deltaproteobacteria bacterium]